MISSTAETLLPRDSQGSTPLTQLSPDLLGQIAGRLRVSALIYAFVFAMSDPVAATFLADERVHFFSKAIRWVPAVLSIGMALVVAAVASSKRLSVHRVLTLGVVFEIAGSFGIATGQYLDPVRWQIEPPWGGLSWVAIWMLGFTVLVPRPPGLARVSALASASSVPLTVALVMATHPETIRLSPVPFFFRVILPYLLVVLVAYLSAQIIYRLGAEVTRARELGSYRLIERLGQGGMGEVWRARHRLLARPAAVKLIRPAMLGGSSPGRQTEMHARFEREAQATAAMRSPHTIQLYDFGIAADNTFYYVMELLDGFDLQSFVEHFGPMSEDRTIYVLMQVCHSLAEAHAAALIHRDIKPANVYICRQGQDVDFVKVLDFGLVKSQQQGSDLTIAGEHTAGGTPAFMAPEQVLGDRPLDGRSDIYATGCLAYWLVTGQLVFVGRTAMETMMQHTHEPPVPPSQRSELPISAGFDALIADCLAKNPDDRPATADALAARLAALGSGATWTPQRRREWWDTHHPDRRDTVRAGDTGSAS